MSRNPKAQKMSYQVQFKSIEEINIILSSLSEMPYKMSFQIIESIKSQITPQFEAASKAAEDKPEAE